MAHSVSVFLENEFDCYFTPYYADSPFLRQSERLGLLNFTAIGGQSRERSESYFAQQGLKVDHGGKLNDYDLVVTTSDLLIQRNIRNKPIVLIQEGMTDPENIMYHLVRWLKLPRYLASTSTTGLSNAFKYFCVASSGYRDLFIRKGVDPEKIVITGIPNYDNLAQYLDNDFPHKNYVLVATSDARETLKYDNRKKFLRHCKNIANGRQLIFKLHPNENADRAIREIKEISPDALVFTSGNTNHMIANCDVLITQYSTVVYVGLVLGKECFSYFDIDELKRLNPMQNGGTSAANIAEVCRRMLTEKPVLREHAAQGVM